MSHLVKKECTLSDLQTLLDAARMLGWSVGIDEKVKYFLGYGQEVCPHVLHLTGEVSDYGQPLGEKYSIGITQEDGKTLLHHDNAMNGSDVMAGDKVDSCTERILNKLKQSYQVGAAKRVAQKKGWRVQEQRLEDGRVVLKMRV